VTSPAIGPDRSSRVLAALGLAALVALAWWIDGHLSPGKTTSKSFDLVNYYFPLYRVTFGWIADGKLPLWNPYHLTGIPWLATLQAGVFYPPHLLYVLLPTNVALASSHLLHLLLIALATAAFLRKLGLGPAPCALAAILFTLRGTVQWWMIFPSVFEAGAWLPVGAIGVVGIARGDGPRSIALLAFATAMSLLAGYTQATVFCLYAWGTLLLTLSLAAGTAPRTWLGAALAFAIAVAVGALLSSIQTLPTFELTQHGTRTTEGLSRMQAQGHGASFSWLLSQIAVGSHISLGLTTLALAPAALVANRQRALVFWATAIALTSYVLALGSGTTIVEVYRSLPVLGWFRNPRRLLFLTNFALAILAAVSLEALLGRDIRRRAVALTAAVSAICVAVLVLTQGAAVAALAAGGLAGAVLLCGLPQGRSARLVGASALLALAFLDARIEESKRGALPYAREDAERYDKSAELFTRLAVTLGDDRAVWMPVRRDRELKLAAEYRLRWLDDYEPLNLRRQSEYFTFLQHGRTSLANARGFYAGVALPQSLKPESLRQWLGVAGRRRLLDLGATRFIVIPKQLRNQETARAFLATAKLAPRAGESVGYAVFENPHALPRAFVTYRSRVAPATDELLPLLAAPDFDPLQESYVEGTPLMSDSANLRGHPARILRDGETLVEIEVELAAPGLVVLADSFFPGWEATIDGEPATILATNHLFRGVPTPAGRHVVRFEYRPGSFRLGTALTSVGLGLFVFLLLQRPPRSTRRSGGRHVGPPGSRAG
jgi:hypothetical protein